MIKTLTWQLNKINVNEALKYLGYSGRACVEEEPLVSECAAEVLSVLDFKACYGVYDIASDGESLDLGFAKVKSRSLSIYLAGCRKIIVFACTAGIGVDRLIAKYSRISPAKASVIQAVGSACAEDFCDFLQNKFTDEYGAKTSRFSCGFGDLPLTLQRDIFSALAVTKNTGITLSDDCFMTPTKSVTAIIGIK